MTEINPLQLSDEDLLEHSLNNEAPVEAPQEPVEASEEAPVVDTPTEALDVIASPEAPPEAPNYEEFYARVTGKFKANGKEIQVTSPEDIVSLMQQGANYSKKMAAIKPVMRVGKLLEENQLMDEEQLNYLIDLHNKKPEAIAKLLKDSDIDLYDFDTSKGDNYIPTPRQVVEPDSALTAVLEDLQQSSQTFSRTIGIVGNDWDEDSRALLAQHPELIRILDNQVADGTFDRVSQAVQYERMMGRLPGVSDLEAYRMMGERLYSQNSVQQPSTAASAQQPATPVPSNDRRKAAALPRKEATDTYKADFNPLAVSDEELLKIAMNNQRFG